MKKNIFLLLLFVIGGCCFFGKTVEATQSDATTDVMITLPKEEVPLELPPISQPPLLNDVATSPISQGKLPSTGDLITSIIWTLLGCSLLIIFIGVYSLKHVFNSKTNIYPLK
ncbi:hypothetical protein UAW_01840 [Enterococcus haemoperoxidus ATCC BAA-382]|uniref:LPXTG-domain-containing protein cell wall anchor domain n=1 Tax=Enterococcus haemoperoxidus ATCC BAA-382 TaxID=1158608 RepID=R2SNC1_9ENTE|nr:hypothetical protein [Enterococcus haemoperoxidus]EOH96675.1 hypothetical protein UAW_01840 [Enterococcus haemoperoxidus ATCC BAA-382]EOT60171.1 hypothetical protein I583_02806 [Enterococcus haemoperoxidus ATCC BAA-382]